MRTRNRIWVTILPLVLISLSMMALLAITTWTAIYSGHLDITTEIDKLDEENVERIEMLRDMEGEVFSNVQANCDKNDFEALTIEEIGEKLRDMDVIVPYGIK